MIEEAITQNVEQLAVFNDTLIILSESLREDVRHHLAGQSLAGTVASAVAGLLKIPAYLGVEPPRVEELLAFYFPKLADTDRMCILMGLSQSHEKFNDVRAIEIGDLGRLLWGHRSTEPANQIDATTFSLILPLACQGENRLFMHLGLRDRADLSRLLEIYFPKLYERNPDQATKWKAFFYQTMVESGNGCFMLGCEACAPDIRKKCNSAGAGNFYAKPALTL